MRIIGLAIAVILTTGSFGVQANAKDMGKICAAQAQAKGLYGQERIHFEARCKVAVAAAASSPKVVTPDAEHARNGYYAHCLSNSPLLGACPLCVIFLLFAEDDRGCYVY